MSEFRMKQRHTCLRITHSPGGHASSCWFTRAEDASAFAELLHEEHPTWRFTIDGKDVEFPSGARTACIPTPA
jgi:hypothetical protein